MARQPKNPVTDSPALPHGHQGHPNLFLSLEEMAFVSERLKIEMAHDMDFESQYEAKDAIYSKEEWDLMAGILSKLQWRLELAKREKEVSASQVNVFPAKVFKAANEQPAIGFTWATPSSKETHQNGYNSGLAMGHKGQWYRAGGPWVPKADRIHRTTTQELWDAYCAQCAKVNEVWIEGWDLGQQVAKDEVAKDEATQKEIDHRANLGYDQTGRD